MRYTWYIKYKEGWYKWDTKSSGIMSIEEFEKIAKNTINYYKNFL